VDGVGGEQNITLTQATATAASEVKAMPETGMWRSPNRVTASGEDYTFIGKAFSGEMPIYIQNDV